MLKRREKRSFWQNVKEYLWPSMGWKRYGILLWQRLKRISIRAPSHSVAMGLSLGWFVSFNPMIGTHTIWILSLSWLFKANVFATFLGSLVGNIWTFPLFLWMSLQVGQFMSRLTGFVPDFEFIRAIDLFKDVGEPFMYMLFGWPFMGGLAFILAYLPNYYLVRAMKKAYYKKKKAE